MARAIGQLSLERKGRGRAGSSAVGGPGSLLLELAPGAAFLELVPGAAFLGLAPGAAFLAEWWNGVDKPPGAEIGKA